MEVIIPSSDDDDDVDDWDESKTVKVSRVRFSDVIEYIPISIELDFELYEARKLGWDSMLDLQRFKIRVATIKEEISWIFNHNHRTKVFNKRFAKCI